MTSEFIDHNPMLKKPVLLTLSVCESHDGQSRVIVEECTGRLWEASFTQTPSSIIDALVREGFVTEQITVDGIAYDGTLEDVYRDLSVSEDADVDSLLGITDAGRSAMREYAPEATIAVLMKSRPAYAAVFRAVLAACDVEGGIGRESVESVIEDAVSTSGITASDGGRIYPQYFIDALESAGGISWGGAWRTTEAGRQARAV